MSDYDPGVLGVSPHELWSTLAKRRKAVMLWIQECDRSGASDRIDFLLSGGMDVVRDIEKCGSRNGKPNKTVRITNSGLVSRSSHSNRDLSLRSSKWFTNRMNEMQRMKTNNSEEKTIVQHRI